MMFKLDENINGFNVDVTYTHIEPSEILEDAYKSDWRMLRPKLSVVLSYKHRSVVKPYTLSAMDLIKNIKITNGWGRKVKYTGNSVLYVSEAFDNHVYVEEGNSRKPLYASNSQSKGFGIDRLFYEYLPTQEDLKYILWGCLSDCAIVYEYNEDEFAQTFMGECSIQKLRESEVIYNTIKNDIFNLAIGEDIIYETMNVLQEMGIE